MKLRWKLAQWFEAKWWRHYLGNKPVEDYLVWKKNYWLAFVKDNSIQVSPSEKILDAGCGPAGIFMVLLENEVVAIDPLLGKYRSQLPHFQEDRFKSVYFMEMPLERFKAINEFDKIFCLNAINHVADLDICLKNLYNCLRPGGQIFLTMDAHNFIFLKSIFRLFPGDILHPHQHGLFEYEEKMKAAGFQLSQSRLLKHELVFDYFLIEARKLIMQNSRTERSHFS